MDFNFISTDDWDSFTSKFPEASTFLSTRSLKNELEHLRKTKKHNGTLFERDFYTKKRLKDLEWWENSQSMIKKQTIKRKES